MKEKFYTFPQETWSAAVCESKAKRVAKDGLGTSYPFKGYIGSSASCPPAYGKVRYNGGCIHGDEWFNGEIRPFPKLAKGFEIVSVLSWGWRIVKKS